MDLEEFIITVYCLVDELVTELQTEPGWQRLRQRGPAPILDDREVLTIELVGAYLGIDTETALVRTFCHHHAMLFPRLPTVHRTTFTRQAAKLWALKERLWTLLRDRIPHDPTLSLVDSVPIPVCRFGRAPDCQRFPGQAAYGYDAGAKATFFGFRGHVRVCWPGVITAVSLAPANVPDPELVPELVDRAQGLVLGDRQYWHPHLTAELALAGIQLVAPFRKRSADPQPERSRVLNRVRWRIETVIGQLVGRYHLKQVWARDAWHLTNRVLRKVLSHTVGVLLASQQGGSPLPLARLLG